MLIEELIRLGRPLLDGDLDAQEVLELITDVTDDRVKNYYRHVFVVELPPEGSGEPAVLPLQVWGSEEADTGKGKKANFKPDVPKALGAPFVLPSGGNPLNPQGRYGVPVYPCWDPHLQAFRESSNGVRDFLQGRIARTPGLTLSEATIAAIAGKVHETVAATQFGPGDKLLGLLILAQCGEDGFYTYSTTSKDRIGDSTFQHGQFIVPDYNLIAEAVWAAKVAEGREAGSRSGPCSFTGQGDAVVSPYCKAWPWALPTWTCPLPHAGDERMLVEGIGLSEASYRALTMGACVFNRLIRRVSSIVIHEVFSPVADREGRNTASRRKLSALPAIHGSAFLLPLLDQALADPGRRDEFVLVTQARLETPNKRDALADSHIAIVAGFDQLEAVTGFDTTLPVGESANDYRLTLVYFSGEYTRGDIHLLAFIQDVIPSTLGQLKKRAREVGQEAMAVLRLLMPSMPEQQVGYQFTCYQSVPYLLARAYGGSYLWQQLERALHREPLTARRVTANAAARMRSLVPRHPDSRFEMMDEVVFYLSFMDFLSRCNRELATEGGNNNMAMRPWKELLQMVEHAPIEELSFQEDNPAELGFACGALIRRFGRWYWMAMSASKPEPDYLRDRVLTFGSDLKPDVIRSRGLPLMFNLSKRLKKLHLSDDFEQRVGVVSSAFERLADAVKRDPDSFMAAFWSGYALQGYDRPKKPTEDETDKVLQARTGGEA